MSDKITNPKTNRIIVIGSPTYKTLLKDGYIHDLTTNTLKLNLKLKPKSNPEPMSKHSIKHKPITLTPDDLTIKHLSTNTYNFQEVIHITDTHIPIHLHLDRKNEYTTVFNRLFQLIRDRQAINNVVIVITGDLLHVKLQLEAETVILARNFLQTLTEIAPTILIIGNHDFTENNLERADTMTAICHGINIHCLKYSGIYQLGNIIFTFSSLVDHKFIYHKDIPNPLNLPIYALFHGTVTGSVNCNGTTNYNKETLEFYPSTSDFIGYDAVLLGHIHKYQKLAPHIAYAGSLIQQNYGEPIENHGILIWNTQTHISTFVHIPNDYIFIDAIIDNGIITNLPEIQQYHNKFLRIRCQNTNTTASQYTTIQEQLKSQFKIHEIKTGKPISKNKPLLNIDTPAIETEHETKLIYQHCQPDLIDKIINLHNTYKTHIINIETYASWNIESIRFKNMFVYGNDHINYVNFINGVNNICSPNMTGKTSLVCIIIYALYNQISHNASKKSDIIHIGKTEGFIELNFNHNAKSYLIEKIAIKKKHEVTFETNFYQLHPDDTKTCLNGATITKTIDNIKQYIGDFNLFTTHHIISTRLGTSLITMPPADKLKHFHKLCNTDQYENYIKLSTTTRKELETQLNLVNGKLNNLLEHNSKTNIEHENTQLTTLTQQQINLQDEIDQLQTQIQQLTSEHNQTHNLIQTLSTQIINQSHPPTLTIPEINQIITQNNQQIQSLNPDSSINISNQTPQSINSLINTYQSLIISDPHQLDDINQQIDQLKQNIKQQQQPIESLSILTNQQTTLLYKLSQDQKLLKTIHLSQPIPFIDINLKSTLEKQKQQFSQCIKPNITLIEATNQLNNLNLSETPPSLDLLQSQLTITNHQILETKQHINNIKHQPMSETTLTQSELTNNIKLETQIGNKYQIKNNEINILQTKITQLTGQNEFLNTSEILSLLHSLDKNITSEQIQSLINFTLSIENGNFSQIIKLNNQIQEINQKINHNTLIDQQINQNQQILNNNNQIQQQINWLNYQQLITKLTTLNQTLQNIQTQIQYWKLNSIIQNIDALRQLDNINTQLEHINQYTQQTLANTLINNINTYQSDIKLITNQIEWYQLHHKLNDLINRQQTLINNQKYTETINNLQLQLQIIILHQNNTLMNQLLLTWNQINTNSQLTTQIQLLTPHLTNINQQLTTKTNNKQHLQQSINHIVGQLNISQFKITQYNLNLTEIETTNKINLELTSQIQLHTEYEKLFKRENLPFKLMTEKLTSFNDRVNDIFQKYTKYSFNYDQSERGKLIFLTINKTNQCILEPEQLSGFESVILHLAINQAILSIISQFKCGFIIIDESLDCIDNTRFIDQLPDIIEAIKQYYQTILLISHRDVSTKIIDKQLKIHNQSTYSTIN